MGVTPEQMAEWQRIVRETGAVLQDYFPPYITPIARVLEHDYGRLEGSGSFIESQGRRFLITNEHVASAMQTNSLSHMFNGCEHHFRVQHPFIAEEFPRDVAVSPIDDKVWNLMPHEAKVIPEARFDSSHRPVPAELLAMCGFAGENEDFHFGILFTRYTPYTTQETHPQPELHEKHFAIEYRPDRAIPVQGRGNLPGDPSGFSGSLLWNTRRVECLQKGVEWTPDLAVVTGIIHRWDGKAGILIATRVEEITDFLHNEVPQRL